MNSEGLERKWPWSNLNISARNYQEALSKTTKRVSQNNRWGAPAGIRNEHISDTNQEHYLCANLPGGPPRPLIVASCSDCPVLEHYTSLSVAEAYVITSGKTNLE